MELTEKINPHSRTKGNELSKGYYPTFHSDVELVKKVVSISFGWDRTGVHEKMVTIFDPCAGEGTFLSSMVRHAKQAATESSAKNTAVASCAVELDSERFRKIRGTDQKLHSSFFDTTCSGSFDILLLNRVTAIAIPTTPTPPAARVIPFQQPASISQSDFFDVIVFEEGLEVVKKFPFETYHEYLAGGMLDVTLFGTYLVTGKQARHCRA